MHLCIFNATNIHKAKKNIYENLHLRYVYPNKMDTLMYTGDGRRYNRHPAFLCRMKKKNSWKNSRQLYKEGEQHSNPQLLPHTIRITVTHHTFKSTRPA